MAFRQVLDVATARKMERGSCWRDIGRVDGPAAAPAGRCQNQAAGARKRHSEISGRCACGAGYHTAGRSTWTIRRCVAGCSYACARIPARSGAQLHVIRTKQLCVTVISGILTPCRTDALAGRQCRLLGLVLGRMEEHPQLPLFTSRSRGVALEHEAALRDPSGCAMPCGCMTVVTFLSSSGQNHGQGGVAEASLGGSDSMARTAQETRCSCWYSNAQCCCLCNGFLDCRCARDCCH
jgi:hypothetical protein